MQSIIVSFHWRGWTGWQIASSERQTDRQTDIHTFLYRLSGNLVSQAEMACYKTFYF